MRKYPPGFLTTIKIAESAAPTSPSVIAHPLRDDLPSIPRSRQVIVPRHQSILQGLRSRYRSTRFAKARTPSKEIRLPMPA